MCSCVCIYGVYIYKRVLEINVTYIPQLFCRSCFELGMPPHLIYVDACVLSTLSIEQCLGHVKLVFSFVNLSCVYVCRYSCTMYTYEGQRETWEMVLSLSTTCFQDIELRFSGLAANTLLTESFPWSKSLVFSFNSV